MRKFIIAIFILLILSVLSLLALNKYLEEKEAFELMEAKNDSIAKEMEKIEKQKKPSSKISVNPPSGPNILKDKNENLERWKAAKEKLGDCEKVRFISFDSAYCAD